MNKHVFSKRRFRFICILLLIILAAGSFYSVWLPFARTHNQTRHLLGLGNRIMVTGVYAALFIFFSCRFDAFKIGDLRASSNVSGQIVALLLTDVIEIFASIAITGQFRFLPDFAWRYALLFLFQSLLLSGLLILEVKLYRTVFPPLRLLEVYGDHSNALDAKIISIPGIFSVRTRLHFSEPVTEKLLSAHNAVLINDIPPEAKNGLLKECFRLNKAVYYVPTLSDILIGTSGKLNLFDTPLSFCSNSGLTLENRILKRFFDVFFSALAILILSPLLLLTAATIRLEDGGPVIYRQKRCTVGGKEFIIYKFRSMIPDAEKDGRPHPAGEKDDRITRVGRIIRPSRIDELPQLFNILRGEMSIVGPRPERIEHVLHYTEQIPEFSFRCKMKAGLTGYAQVYGKYNTAPLDKLKMDCYYIMNYSLRLDFEIIVNTLRILFQKESTEGFTAEKSAEIHDDSYDKRN